MENKDVAVKIDKNSYAKLKERKEKTGITIIHMIHEAIDLYLDKYNVSSDRKG